MITNKKISFRVKLIILIALFVVLLIAALLVMNYFGVFYKKYQFAIGDGTSKNPYQLSTKEDLIGLQQDVKNNKLHYNECFILKNDIDLGGINWCPIGTEKRPFTGMIDGNGFSIFNYKIIDCENNAVGFFAKVWSNSNNVAVKNLKMSEVKIEIENFSKDVMDVGVLVGSINGATIENCYVEGDIKLTNCRFNGVGTLVGDCNGNISNCIAGGKIEILNPEYEIWGMEKFWPQIGGIAGNISGNIDNCINRTMINATVKPTNNSLDELLFYTGGIVGNMHLSNTWVKNCINEAIINSVGVCGGIVGTLNADVIISDCINKAKITSSGEVDCSVGGILGENWSWIASVINCGNEGDLSINTNVRWWNSEIVEKVTNSTAFTSADVGGIVACGKVNIINCVNKGNLSAEGDCVHFLGGIIGECDGNITIKNNYNTGDIIGYSKYSKVVAAGLTAVVIGQDEGCLITMENNYSSGRVLNYGHAIKDACGTLGNDLIGGCVAYICSTKNILRYNYCVSNPIGEKLEGYNCPPEGWYSVEEQHAISDTYVGNTSVTLERLLNGCNLGGFSTFIGKEDVSINEDNVWIFSENELPKLFWECE